MRLDARNGDVHWWIYDAEACAELRDVVFVDDETNQYGVFAGPNWVTHQMNVRTIQARKIVIYPERRLVIINPVDDAEPLKATTDEEVTA